ncbi:c-type cytochrome [Polynucleobacter brandtiae]|uniref:Cytochrome c n=1 Tax=Polynucleobacter brandtiae TaxID=1938816 RepID=A0A2M8VRV0_9BURK|nr:c-type cytochrome [Polynucleobacter brandtiae]PJI80194.1 cytochrome c [Polynucleobacter brandtiae]
MVPHSQGANAANVLTQDQAALLLAKQNACLGCHAVNKKIVGPSFQDIAKKYRSDPSAADLLKNKIHKGGAGSWGVVPMPGNTKLSDDEIASLVTWILRGAIVPN